MLSWTSKPTWLKALYSKELPAVYQGIPSSRRPCSVVCRETDRAVITSNLSASAASISHAQQSWPNACADSNRRHALTSPVARKMGSTPGCRPRSGCALPRACFGGRALSLYYLRSADQSPVLPLCCTPVQLDVVQRSCAGTHMRLKGIEQPAYSTRRMPQHLTNHAICCRDFLLVLACDSRPREGSIVA